MKDIAECSGLFMLLSSKGLPKSVRQRQRSCLFGRDLRSLWQTDFATPWHWIPGQITPPNRYALWRGPRQAGMTQYRVDWGLFRASFPPSNILLILSIQSSAFYFVFTITTPPRHYDTTKSFQGTFPPFHLSTFPRPNRSTYIL